MSEANFEGAYEYISKQLENLDKRLWYHGKHHTIDDVLPCAIFLCKEENLTEEETLLVKTAALYHDVGFLDQYEKNEPKGCDWSRKTLPNFNFSSEQIEKICEIIMATQLPQSPKDHLAQIMCDADLGHLGSEKYFLRAEGLRLELEQMNSKEIDVKAWNCGNIKFLENHNFFTKSAQKHFGEKKQNWINKMKEIFLN
jgi:uncharacterized protein